MATFISPDALLVNNSGIYNWTPKRAKGAWDSSYKRLEQEVRDNPGLTVFLMCGPPGAGKTTFYNSFLDSMKCIVYDATFVRERDRARFLLKVRRARFTTDIVCVVLDTALDVCLKRNSDRSFDRKVPEDILKNMHNNFSNNYPKLQEGFNGVLYIKNNKEKMYSGNRELLGEKIPQGIQFLD